MPLRAKSPSFLELGSDATPVVGTAFLDAASGLNIPVSSGVAIRFYYLIQWVANATTTGAHFSFNGPSVTRLTYSVRYNTNATVFTQSAMLRLYDANTGNAVGTDSNATENLAIIEGIFMPSASGTFALRSAAEIASPGSVTVKAGSSVMWW